MSHGLASVGVSSVLRSEHTTQKHHTDTGLRCLQGVYCTDNQPASLAAGQCVSGDESEALKNTCATINTQIEFHVAIS